MKGVSPNKMSMRTLTMAVVANVVGAAVVFLIGNIVVIVRGLSETGSTAVFVLILSWILYGYLPAVVVQVLALKNARKAHALFFAFGSSLFWTIVYVGSMFVVPPSLDVGLWTPFIAYFTCLVLWALIARVLRW